MRRLLIYAALALAVFSLTYCSDNEGNENAGNTTHLTTPSTVDTTATYGTGTGMDTTSTDIGTGTGTGTGSDTAGGDR